MIAILYMLPTYVNAEDINAQVQKWGVCMSYEQEKKEYIR